MNYNLLIGISLGLMIFSAGIYIYYNLIVEDGIIFLNSRTDEILTLQQFQDKINPIIITMFGLSILSLFMLLLSKHLEKIRKNNMSKMGASNS